MSFVPSLPAQLRCMTGALVKVLLWLLAQAISQGGPSACLSSLSVPGFLTQTPLPHKAAVSLQATCVKPKALI